MRRLAWPGYPQFRRARLRGGYGFSPNLLTARKDQWAKAVLGLEPIIQVVAAKPFGGK
jgi:hypothetical protein